MAQIGREHGGEQAVLANIQDMFNSAPHQKIGMHILNNIFIKNLKKYK